LALAIQGTSIYVYIDIDMDVDRDVVMGLGHANGHMDKHITATCISLSPRLPPTHNIVKSSKGAREANNRINK